MSSFGEKPLSLQEDIASLSPFTYDHQNRKFTIGKQDFSLSEENLVDVFDAPPSSTVLNHEIQKYPLHITDLGILIATPMFYSWLCDRFSGEDALQAKTVIKETFYELMELSPDNEQHNSGLRTSHYEPGAGFLREGHLTLRTVGDCACLGVDLYGVYVDEGELDTGYAEYYLHNIDQEEQKISLFAGLGFIASLAARSREANT